MQIVLSQLDMTVQAIITNSPAKLMPVKPKVYLLATVRIAAQSWVNLSQ